jgi:MFS family permease
MAVSNALARDIRIVGLVCSGHFFGHFAMLTLPPIFVLMKAEFGVSYTELALILTAYGITSGFSQLPVGFLVDRFGAKGPLLAQGLWVLVLLGATAGLGNCVLHPADYSILSASVDRARMGRAFSVHTFSGVIGWAAAPPFMILITELASWRMALVAAGLLGLVIVAVLALQHKHLSGDQAAGWQPEKQSPRPDFGLGILLAPPILLLFGFFATISMISAGLHAFSVPALVQLHGFELTMANAALTAFLVASAVGVLLGGVIADRTDRYDFVAGIGFLIVAILLAAIASFPMPALVVIITFALAGLVQAAIWPSRDMIVRSVTPEGASGKVFGFVSTGLDVGGILAPPFFGLMIDIGHPSAVFWVTAAVVLAGLLFSVTAAQFARRGVTVAAE